MSCSASPIGSRISAPVNLLAQQGHVVMQMEYPSFSIIIPTYNRTLQLGRCLEAVANLDYPLNCFEVIVVDDGSKEPPSDVIDLYSSRFSLKMIRQQNRGPAGARNTGAAQAGGKFLAFTDDDCAPGPKWLRSLAAGFAKRPDIAIGGRTENAIANNLYSSASQYILDCVYACFNTDPEQSQFFASNNLALPRDLFLAMGGFDAANFPEASEDRDLCNRWLHHGYRIAYAPDALVYHSHYLTLTTFIKQHFRYGRGAFRYHMSCRLHDPKYTVVKMPYYIYLLRRIIIIAVNPKTLPLAIMLVLLQAANTTGYFVEWAKKHDGKQA